MLTALITLSRVSWAEEGWLIPSWYVLVVVARDVSIGLGCFLILLSGKKVLVKPCWLAKTTTFVQLFTLAWIMLKVPSLSHMILIMIATVFTIWSSWFYVREAIRQLQPN